MYFKLWERILVTLTIIVALFTLVITISTLRDYQPIQFTGEVCSDEITKAMDSMGPRYNYIMIGETLYVDKGDGKWLRLKYKRGRVKWT